jgi:hypothetical protein
MAPDSKLALALDSTLGRQLEHIVQGLERKLVVRTIGLVGQCTLLGKLGPEERRLGLELGLERRLGLELEPSIVGLELEVERRLERLELEASIVALFVVFAAELVECSFELEQLVSVVVEELAV